MARRAWDFAEGLRKNLGIALICEDCAKRVVYRCGNFQGYLAPNADIEHLTWRCGWCQTPSHDVRYVLLDGYSRESSAQWRPSPGMKRRF